MQMNGITSLFSFERASQRVPSTATVESLLMQAIHQKLERLNTTCHFNSMNMKYSNQINWISTGAELLHAQKVVIYHWICPGYTAAALSLDGCKVRLMDAIWQTNLRLLLQNW